MSVNFGRMAGGIVLMVLGVVLFFGVSPEEGEEVKHRGKARFLANIIGEKNYLLLGKGLAALLFVAGAVQLVVALV